MLRHIAVFSLVCALVAGVALSAAAQTRVPPINFKERTLANGLKVYSAQERTSPTVAIQVWYKVGSKDDPDKRSGFAHLFEHLMFKSARNLRDEQMDRLTEDVGGWNNASTSDDVTNYYEVVPSNYLETLLWAEADRMGGLNVNDKNFPSERDVVKEEFNTSVLAPPYGRLFYSIDKNSFTTHPYHRPTIGSKEDLDAATLEDVKAFHKTFYRPDNAVLIVVGDFDDKQLDGWIDKYFNRIAKPAGTVPRVTVKEPERTAEKRYNETGPNVPLPAVALTYLAPPISSPDADVLRVAESILSNGESSRLYQSLVYTQQLAAEAFASASLRQDPGYFAFGAILASDKKVEDAERALLAELKKMQDAPVTKAELEKAINQLVANQLRERETNSGKAFAIGNAVVLMGDAKRVNTDVERLQAVTAADIQRVMKKYFTDTNRVVITYKAESAKPTAEAKPAAQPSTEVAATADNTAPCDPKTAGVLNCNKLNNPQPSFPAEAKKAGAQGAVMVEVVVNEQGNVIKAKAKSGSPLLRKAAEDAARQAKFKPTLLSGVPVKVVGTITYNFELSKDTAAKK